MKNWINKHFKTIITSAFLIPIITVAIVSISHVTKWYGISNPISWSLYLSIGIEIAALSSLAAISVNMGKKIYLPFGIVTFVQFIGNVYFAYLFIDINGQSFISWVELISPIGDLLGIKANDLVSHKRFLALFSGGLLPLISLSFLHMLVKFTEEDRKVINEGKEQEKSNVIEEDKKVPFNHHFCPETTGYCDKKECDNGRLCIRKTAIKSDIDETVEEPPLVLSDETLKQIETILEKKNELINQPTDEKIFKDLPVDKIIEYNTPNVEKNICPVTKVECETCPIGSACELQSKIMQYETSILNKNKICPVTNEPCDNEGCSIDSTCQLQYDDIKPEETANIEEINIPVSERITLRMDDTEKKKNIS